MKQVVVIEWGDAWIETDDFETDDVSDIRPVYRKTVGFLIGKNDTGYVVSTDVYDDKEHGVGAAQMFIPHGMVTRVIYMGAQDFHTCENKEITNVG